MKLADVNVDAKADIVFWDTSGIGVARGNGNGTFQAPTFVTLPANTNTRDFQIADVNADSNPDLVFGSSAGVHNLRISLSDGSGAFGAPQSYDTGNKVVDQIEVVDLNGDGKKDLVALVSTYSIAVLLNTGSSFSAAQEYPVGGGYRIAIGDLTGDGKPDVVAADQAGTVSVLVNTGAGAFASRVTYTSPEFGWGIVLADVNEDGKRDVVVATYASGAQISVLLNQGSGVLGAATSFPLGVSTTPRMLAAADVNGDGHVDIGAAYLEDYSAKLLLGTGTGAFGAALSLTNYNPTGIAFEDLNNDGRSDMVLANEGSTTAYLNDGPTALFQTRAPFEFGVTTASGSSSARMTDLNDDGRLDLVWFSGNSAPPVPARLRLANADGSFALPTAFSVNVSPFPTGLSDVDNNGRADLILVAGSSVQTVLNDGTGTLSATALKILPGPGKELSSADLDGNGVRDLVIGDGALYPSYASNVRYYPGFANGQFGGPTMLWAGEWLRGLAVADLNGDGTRDVVIDSYYNYSNQYRQEVLLGIGSGSFAAPVLSTVAGLPESRLFARDFNGDGKLDVIGFRADTAVVMLGNGDGTFGAPLHSAAPGLQTTDVAFADFDGNGHLDVVMPSTYLVGVLLGNGDGTFGTPLYYEAGVDATTVNVGDVDRDGRVDIMVNNRFDRVNVLYGRCLQ